MVREGSFQFWRATLALCLASIIVFINVYLTQPMLPLFVEVFDLSPSQANWSLTITTTMLGLSLLVYGPLSDAFGRKWIMVASLVGSALVTFLISQVESFSALIILRAVQGFFLGGVPAIAVAYMSEEFSPKALSFGVGLYISGNSLGGISSRVLGGLGIDYLGWSDTFLWISILSLICIFVFVWGCPTSSQFERKPLRFKAALRSFSGHLSNPKLLFCYFIGAFNFMAFLNQFSFITFVLKEAPYGLPASIIGMLFVTYLGGTFAASLAGKAARWMPQPACMAIGILISLTGSSLTLAGELSSIIVGLILVAFGFFFTHSSASSWVGKNAKSAKASASSLYLVFYYFGAALGAVYLQPMWNGLGWQGVVLGVGLIGVCGLLCCAFLYFLERSPAQFTVTE